MIGGGHSIDDPEPKYGLAVSGLVDPEAMLTNAGARQGDVLVLTKPLGSGIATTAAKRGVGSPELIARATEVMCELNERASRAAVGAGATAATDVTGFGLLGHLNEMCAAAGVGAVIEASLVPAIEGVLDMAADGNAIAGGSRRNRDQAERFTTWAPGVSEERRILLTDAMTSGGLLVSVAAERADEVPGPVIGEISAGPEGSIEVR